MPGLQLTRETVMCVQPAGVTENKMTNNSCGEVKQCSERKNRRRRGRTEWEKKADGESAKEEEKKRRRRMYQCLRAVGGLPGAL